LTTFASFSSRSLISVLESLISVQAPGSRPAPRILVQRSSGSADFGLFGSESAVHLDIIFSATEFGFNLFPKRKRKRSAVHLDKHHCPDAVSDQGCGGAQVKWIR
jgi:hypothetical protein